MNLLIVKIQLLENEVINDRILKDDKIENSFININDNLF